MRNVVPHAMPSQIRNAFLYSLDLFFPEQPCRPDKEDQQKYEESKGILVRRGNKAGAKGFQGAKEQAADDCPLHATVPT